MILKRIKNWLDYFFTKPAFTIRVAELQLWRKNPKVRIFHVEYKHGNGYHNQSSALNCKEIPRLHDYHPERPDMIVGELTATQQHKSRTLTVIKVEVSYEPMRNNLTNP